ncbi:LuxR family transcriptional regulator [Actinosynnema sp. ALI-1.44]|uniref:response regulator n=1 Tax=Actinosynnema sp. ALI-1.44 TaxID=1933779 RepID=UPI00097C6D44|nr:response regulator [Actinosynnema sp. ALI-1.44]ONI87557.1 LuxR family transcriptional regulator [Actinosynnema sp. ALI-1.44]
MAGGDAGPTIAVIDDHPAIVAGVRAWCAASCPSIDVVAVGANVSAAWTHPGADADVVVMDLMLDEAAPAMGDLRRLADAGRRVVVYSMRTDDRTVLSSLEIGAYTYLTKAEGEQHLVAAIHAAAADLPYTAPNLAGSMYADSRKCRPRLTPREQNALMLWFRCESKEMVADRMGVSASTVNTYLDRVRIKYANVGRAAATKTALLARAMQDGLISLDEL